MKQMVSCLLTLMLWVPLAAAQAPSDEYEPDESEEPVIQPEEPPGQEPLPGPIPDEIQMRLRKLLQSWSQRRPVDNPPTSYPADMPLSPPPPDLDQGNLPPGYTARWVCMHPHEEEVENGAAIYGLKPKKVRRGWEGGPEDDLYPLVCRQKEVPITYEPAEIDTSMLPPGYTARAAVCDPDEEEVENGAKLFGIPPLQIPFGGEQWMDWYPRVCRKKR
jgi:hypothetical protein